MPIEGITDQTPKNILDGLPIMADVFKGTARTPEDIAKKRPGKELPHFRVVFRPHYAHLQPTWDEMYGAEPTQLSGAFIGANTVHDAFVTFNREWGKTGIVRECTGKTIVRQRDETIGRLVHLDNVACKSDSEKGCDCKREGTLYLMFPEFSALTGVIAKVRFTTHSFEDIISIHKSLATVQMLYGSLHRAYFTIYREQGETSFFDKREGVRKKMKKWFMKIRLDEAYVKATLATQLTAGVVAPQLVASSSPVVIQPTVEADEYGYEEGYPADDYMGDIIEEAPRTPVEPTWIATNGNLRNVLKWAQQFGLQENEVFDALHKDDATIFDIRDYTGNANRVRGAIIAFASGWDLTLVSGYCNDTKLVYPKDAVETENSAKEIIQKVAEELGADHVPNDTPDLIITSA